MTEFSFLRKYPFNMNQMKENMTCESIVVVVVFQKKNLRNRK